MNTLLCPGSVTLPKSKRLWWLSSKCNKKLNVSVDTPLLTLILINRSDKAATNLSSFCGSPQTAFLAAVLDFNWAMERHYPFLNHLLDLLTSTDNDT